MSQAQTCEAVSTLLSDRLDGSLPACDTQRVRMHLNACASCRTLDAQLVFIRRAVQQGGERQRPWLQPPIYRV